MIQFIKKQIIHRFGIPQSISTNLGAMFIGDEMTYFTKEYVIQLIRSTPFYAQENGQAETSNKVLINIIEKMQEDNPRDWHKILSETLWSYRTSKRVSPYSLTYGQDAVLPMEVVVPSLRISKQNCLNHQEYSEAMMMELEALDGKRLQVLDHIMIQKKVTRAYKKQVRRKSFEEGDFVWKVVLPTGAKDRELGKWSPNWEGPFKLH